MYNVDCYIDTLLILIVLLISVIYNNNILLKKYRRLYNLGGLVVAANINTSGV